MHEDFNFSYVGTDQSAKLTGQVDSPNYSSTMAKLAKPTAPIGSANSPMTSSVNSLEKLSNRPDVTSSDVGADLDDWRTPLLRYLRDPSAKIDKSVRRSAFKYVLHNDELYRRTAKDFCAQVLRI